jgi:hypothetical protein
VRVVKATDGLSIPNEPAPAPGQPDPLLVSIEPLVTMMMTQEEMDEALPPGSEGSIPNF